MEFEEIFTVHVQIEHSIHLEQQDGDSVTMISFKGQVTGQLFHGDILDGGVDTQIIGKLGSQHTLSARYMLQGKDHTGEPCKIYIENNGNINSTLKDAIFRSYPKVITDSKALAFLNDDFLVAEGRPAGSGIDIKIFRNRRSS